MEIGRWGGRTFTVSSSLIRGFTGLTIKGSSETEDKKDNKQKYVARKNGNPAEISMTVQLHASLGVKVRGEALAFVSDAQAGKEDYFYLGGNKLVTYKLMLTDAAVEETQINAAGEWVSCKVKLTFKQCSKLDGSTSSSSSGSSSNKQSVQVKNTTTGSTKSTAITNIKEPQAGNKSKINSDVDTVTMAQPSKTGNASLLAAVNAAKATTGKAKIETAQKTTTSLAFNFGGTSTTKTTTTAKTTAAAKAATTTSKTTTFTFAKSVSKAK